VSLQSQQQQQQKQQQQKQQQQQQQQQHTHSLSFWVLRMLRVMAATLLSTRIPSKYSVVQSAFAACACH